MKTSFKNWETSTWSLLFTRHLQLNQKSEKTSEEQQGKKTQKPQLSFWERTTSFFLKSWQQHLSYSRWSLFRLQLTRSRISKWSTKHQTWLTLQLQELQHWKKSFESEILKEFTKSESMLKQTKRTSLFNLKIQKLL